jgi:hypothetical protein
VSVSLCIFRPQYQLENRWTDFDGTLIEPVVVTPLLVTCTTAGVSLLQMVVNNAAVAGTFEEALTLKADSHIACRAHAVPLPCRADTGLECVFPV